MSTIDCEVIDAAGAAVVLLNTPVSPAWLKTFTAVRAFRPVYDLDQLSSLLVTVVSKDETPTKGSRLKTDNVVSFDVGIQQRVKTDADTDILMRLRRQVRTLLEQGLPPIGTYPNGLTWMATVGDPIYSPEHLKKGLFTSVLTFSYFTRMVRK
jgi:hypothetical protein